jgi:hypothetical protein
MANIKITDLTAYGNPTSTDVLPIVDVGADVTKKVSVADLLENAGSGTEPLPGIAFDGDPDTGIYRLGADQLAISTNGTGRLFVDASGNVGVGTSSPAVACDVVGQVRASTGILFGNDTAAANALDDYEEGTWTPSLVFLTSGSVLATSEGYYTKIGRQVFVHCIVRVGTLSSPTGDAVIEGLPFPANSSGTFPQYMNIGNTSNSHDLVGNINPDSTLTADQATTINLFKDVEQSVRLDGADIIAGPNATAIRISMSYTT